MATNACSEVHPNIVDLISSYTILSSIAPWLSTLDLHNLSLTNRSAYTSIHSSDKIFNFLARQSLCDGRGLAVRQAFKGSYHPNPMPGRWDINPHLSGDEEIEVYLYNVKMPMLSTRRSPNRSSQSQTAPERKFRARQHHVFM
jgi:hypothetical protein